MRKKIFNKMTNNSNYVKNKTKCEWIKQSDEKTHCQTGIKKKRDPNYIFPTRDILYIKYTIRWKVKYFLKDHANSNHNKTEVSILMSEKIDS